MILAVLWYYRGVKKLRPGRLGPLNSGGPCALHNLLLRHWF